MHSLEQLPIVITMGDPCGIGPEIIAMLCANTASLPSTLVLGDEGLIKRAVRILDLPLTVKSIASPEEFKHTPGTINVISVSNLPDDLPFGQLDARAGKAAFDYVRAGIDLALQKRIRAIVTAPINKEALRLADIHYPGHTEILADFSGTKDFAMMLMNNDSSWSATSNTGSSERWGRRLRARLDPPRSTYLLITILGAIARLSSSRVPNAKCWRCASGVKSRCFIVRLRRDFQASFRETLWSRASAS
jgi:hypothetical protein